MLTLALALLASTPEPLAVQGDLVLLRADAHKSAPVVARLRFGTALDRVAPNGVVQETRDGFVHVSVAGRPAKAALVGWIAQELVGAPLTVDDVLLATRARDPAARVTWARRYAAIDASGHALEVLEEALTDAGDLAGAKRVARTRAGLDPVWMARCQSGRAVLLAVDEPGRGVRALAGDTPPLLELNALAHQLDGATWYPAPTPNAALTVVGSPFATPFLATMWNDITGPFPPQPGERVDELDNGLDPGKLVLGPCDDEGALLFTAPVSLTSPHGVPAETAQTHAAALVRDVPVDLGARPPLTVVTTEARALPGGPHWYSVTLEATWPTHDGDFAFPRAFYTLTDHDDRALPIVPSSTTAVSADGASPQSFVGWAGEGARFLAPNRGPARTYVVLPIWPIGEGDSYGVHIITTRDGQPHVVEVVTDRGGC